MGGNSSKMAEEMAQLRTEMRAERRAQRDKERMAEEIAWLRMERMSMRRPESPDSGVSLKSDQSKEEPIDFNDRVSPRMAEETAQLCMEIQGFFGSDVSAVEDFNKVLNDLRATGRPESPDSDVSFKSDQSKAGLIDFKDRVSPSRPDFSSSEKKHVVSDDGFFESPDDQEKMNQELSSELGWKHGHRQQLHLMVSSYYHAC